MTEKRLCGKCGAELTDVGSERLCPACLLEGGLDGGESVAEKPPWAVPPTSRSAQETTVFYSFGDYELLEEIARGGMGIIYRARQVSLDRIVAVKVLISGLLAHPEFVQRFRAEAAAAASLQHPNIVAIHEVGFREGQHYFAMDYVPGSSLAELTRNGPLAGRRAAGYVKTIAEAIHYAHERGILHRDLKPANVLIDENDQPRVTDFGLAKDLHKQTDLTLSGQVLGSPSYMSPEQAEARRGKVGVRSDVYSLGAILYHLLTARAPFLGDTIAKTLHQVQNDEPVSPRLLNGAVPQDLATICLKCLEKEPEKRYATAQDLAEDLGRFLERKPILARPISRPEKFWRWCRRNPVVATLAATAVLIFVLGFAGVAWQGQRASHAAADAQRLGHVAQGRLYAAQMKLAHAAFKEGKLGGALALLRAQRPAPGAPDFRGFDWRYLYGLCLGSPSEVLATNASGFPSVDYSPDGRTVALGTGAGFVEIFDVQTRQRSQCWQAHQGAVDYLAFYPLNNNWLATVSGDDGVLKLWDIVRGRVLLSTNVVRGMWPGFAFSPGGRFLATRAPDAQSIDLWEFHRGSPDAMPTLTLRTNLAYSGPAVFSADERTLVVCNQTTEGLQSNVALYDLASGVLTNFPTVHRDGIASAAFSPDGGTLATGGADELVLWDVKGQRAIHVNRSDCLVVTSIAFTPDGRTLFASSWDQNIRFWNLDDPVPTNIWRGHGAGVNRLAIAPDGGWLVSASSDGTARLWRLPTARSVSSLVPRPEFTTLFSPKDMPAPEREQHTIFGVAVSPAQDRAVAAADYRLFLCDLRAGTILTTAAAAHVFNLPGHGIGRLTFSPDGGTLAVGSGDGRVAFLDAVTLQRLGEPAKLHSGQITHIAYALNGTVLVTGGGFGSGIKVTDVANGTTLWDIPDAPNSFPVEALAVSPDGKLLAAGGANQSVLVWDIAARRVLATCPQKVRFVHDLAFAPDGTRLAIADERDAIFLWDLRGQRPLRKLVGHAGPVNMLAFSPDGRTLASAGMDHTIRLWHPEIDQEVAILTGPSEWVWCIAFAEHGNALLSGGRDGTLKLWQAASWDEINANERITSFNP